MGQPVGIFNELSTRSFYNAMQVLLITPTHIPEWGINWPAQQPLFNQHWDLGHHVDLN